MFFFIVNISNPDVYDNKEIIVSSDLLFLIICLIPSLAGIIIVLVEKKNFYASFVRVFSVLTCTVFAILFYELSTEFIHKRVFMSLYYFSVMLLLTELMEVVEIYTTGRDIPVIFKKNHYILIFIDFIICLANIFYPLVFTIDASPISSDMTIYTVSNVFPGALIHFGLCGIVCILSFVYLFKGIFRSRGYNRIKYLVVFILMIFVAIGGLINGVMPIPLFLIISLIMLTCYVSYYFMNHLVPLQLMKQTFDMAMHNINISIIVYDNEEKLLYVSDETYKTLNLDKHDKNGVNSFIDLMKDKYNLPDKKSHSWTEKYLQSDKDAKYYEIHYGQMKDNRGIDSGVYYTISDRTLEIKQYEEEHYKITHDSLTGLLNREGYLEEVRKRLDANPDKKYYIMRSNIKDFKMVNDLFGFKKGNEIIKRIADIITTYNAGDVLTCRLDAEQFSLLIETSVFTKEEMKEVLSELTGSLTDIMYSPIMHIGIYEIDDKDLDVSIMLDRANLAISTVRQDNINRIVFYDHSMTEYMLNNKQEAARLNRDLEDKLFTIYLQPQVEGDGKILGAEALVRKVDPIKGVIPPGSFIPVLEEAGCLYKLDKYVWELAAQKLAEWKGTNKEKLHISVNISPTDFYYVDIYETFTELIKKYDLDVKKLKLEITESAMMNDSKKQLALVKKLHDYGFEIEIDDFGSGYSSLNLLKDLNADVVKLDMVFLEKTRNLERSKTILDSIISMSKKLGMTVLAEGVEEENQVDFLSSCGCDIFQGYHFSRPISIKDFEAMYDEKAH